MDEMKGYVEGSTGRGSRKMHDLSLTIEAVKWIYVLPPPNYPVEHRNNKLIIQNVQASPNNFYSSRFLPPYFKAHRVTVVGLRQHR